MPYALRPPQSARAAAAVALTLLALSSFNSKIAGTLWGLTFILTAVIAARRRPWPESDEVDQTARLWVVSTAISLICWTASAAIWGELYPQRSSEINVGIRFVTGSLATYWLTRVVRFQPNRTGVKAVTASLSIASLVALITAQLAGSRDELPSNAIAWAAAIALITVLLVARAVDATQSIRSRVAAFAGVIFGALAVLISQSRGVYPVLAWIIFVMIGAWRLRGASRVRVMSAITLSSIALAIGFIFTISHPADPLRLREAIVSFEEVRDTQQFNTPTGARLYLYGLAWQTFKDSPWIGVGAKNRIELIRSSGLGESETRAAALAHVRELGHAHNAYLHHGMDGGVLALLGFLIPLFTLALMAVKLKPNHPVSALQMWGIAFIHAVTNLTSVNLAHNYYALLLVISVAVVLVQARLEEPRRAVDGVDG